MAEASEGREGLAELFLWWYGFHPACIRMVKSGWENTLRNNQPGRSEALSEFTADYTEEKWRTTWFAKGELTRPVDDAMRFRFGPLLAGFKPKTTDQLQNELDDLPTWEKLALLILYDQVPRNIFRNLPSAYAYDPLGRLLALHFFETKLIDVLPFHYRATVLIAICHSENLEHQKLLEQHLDSDLFRPYKEKSHIDLSRALQTILTKHRERIEHFGRFPERNHILSRTSTTEEISYLSQLK